MTSPLRNTTHGAGKNAKDSMHIVLAMLLFLWEWFPLVLLGIHYFIPNLNQPITAYPDYNGLIIIAVSTVVGAIWVIVEAVRSGHRTTTALALQIDCFRSTLIGNIIIGSGVWLITTGTMEWWFPVAAIMAIVDMFITPVIAINNAIQKPFFPNKEDR